MGVSVWLVKLPTSTWPAATAIACGPGPTGMAAPGCIVEMSMGVTVLLPKSATNAVAAPDAPTKTARATGSVPTGTGRPARHVPRSTGVTVFESRFATSAMPLPPVPPGATATASGSTPTPVLRTTSWVAVSTSCSWSSPCVTTSSADPPGA